ncbi:MAG: hypothetical protein HN891_10295 [Planctomycetes bacterium]|nr:hypothetical protein [Planctomycetota bacterium]MBT6452978.1 hypothetical protein [Planctomycetota bacterium]MBT6541817.1 hypothetical protein [Planctomycetota bacterium]MBT6784571.1 hypothetical protein [Planctomycetota bacterium]MBT6968214.1 hypothetical protein [Planctomycetota bacterium]
MLKLFPQSPSSSDAQHWALWGLDSRSRLAASDGFQEALELCTSEPILAEVLDQHWGQGPDQKEDRSWRLSDDQSLKVCWIQENSQSGAMLLLQMQTNKSAAQRSVSREELVSQLLMLLLPRFLHQLKNHYSVVQNSEEIRQMAMLSADTAMIERCHELGLKGVQRSAALLDSIVSLHGMEFDSIWQAYLSRFQAAKIVLEIDGEVPTGDLWIAALVISLEFARPQLPPESALRISCEKNVIQVHVEGLKSINIPPVQDGFFEEFFNFKTEGVGWVVTRREGESS